MLAQRLRYRINNKATLGQRALFAELESRVVIMTHHNLIFAHFSTHVHRKPYTLNDFRQLDLFFSVT